MANAVQTKKASPVRKEPNFMVKGWQYLRESWAESKRATWPSLHDVQRLTTAVLAGVATVTIFVYVLDLVLGILTSPFFGNPK